MGCDGDHFRSELELEGVSFASPGGVEPGQLLRDRGVAELAQRSVWNQGDIATEEFDGQIRTLQAYVARCKPR